MTLEIVIPLRNPTEVLLKTAESLARQSDRNFSVLVSDNFSGKGTEHIEKMMALLAGAGVSSRKVQPPVELGRVEHWNWLHHQSSADWTKPLFAGDWLEPNYVERLRDAIARHPDCRYICCGYWSSRGQSEPVAMRSVWAGRYMPATEMQPKVISHGMQFGPPSVAAYDRTAFMAVGGYPTTLPICSDSLFFCTLAARFGVLALAEPLAHFNIHDARFSTNLPQKRRQTFSESFTYFMRLAYYEWTEGMTFSRIAFTRLLIRNIKGYLQGR